MTNLNNCLLQVNNLSFERADRELFRKLSFTLNAGTVLQVRGANGIGKTTLLRILAGFIPIDEGDVQWCGRSIQECAGEYRSNLVYIGHQTGITLGLTPRENLRMIAALHQVNLCGLSDIDHWLDQFDLLSHINFPALQLSAGQQRRLAFASLPMRTAKLWILDEPFTALDHKGVAQLEQLIYHHTQQGGVAIVATHQPFQMVSLPLQQLELLA